MLKKNVRTTAYADDLVLSVNDPSLLQQATCEVLGKLSVWSSKNGLKINASKTKYMLFNCKLMPALYITLNGQALEYVKVFKYLGFFLEEKLCWTTHIDDLCQRLQKIICLFRFLRHSFPKEHLFVFYFAYFESVVRYGCCFWGVDKKAKKVLILQKRCLRTILFLKPRTSCRSYFQKHNIATVYNLIIFEICRLVHSNSSRIIPLTNF